jgi:hypothetical protein
VHITVNTEELPRRSGRSNQPYVFRARGALDLRTEVVDIPEDDPLASRAGSVLPPSSDPFATPSSPSKSESGKDREREKAAERGSGSTASAEALAGARWNNPGDFERFFRALAHAQAGLDGAPGLAGSGGETDPEGEEEHAFSPLSSSPSCRLFTPAPVRAGHQMRVDRAARRIRRLSQRGLSRGAFEDEDEDNKANAKEPEDDKVNLKEEEAEPKDDMPQNDDGIVDWDEEDLDESRDQPHIQHVTLESLVRRVYDKEEEDAEGDDEDAEGDDEDAEGVEYAEGQGSELVGDGDDGDDGDENRAEEVSGSETESAQRQRAKAFWDWSPDPFGLKEVEI